MRTLVDAGVIQCPEKKNEQGFILVSEVRSLYSLLAGGTNSCECRAQNGLVPKLILK